MDEEIHANYKIYAVNYVAAYLLTGEKKYEEHFSDTDRQKFEQYISTQIDKINIAGKDNDFLRERMLTMYANPLFNKEKAISHE